MFSGMTETLQVYNSKCITIDNDGFFLLLGVQAFGFWKVFIGSSRKYQNSYGLFCSFMFITRVFQCVFQILLKYQLSKVLSVAKWSYKELPYGFGL